MGSLISILNTRLRTAPHFGFRYEKVERIFGILGCSVLLYHFLTKIVCPVFKEISLVFSPDLQKRYGKDSWAVVTKASSPVGEKFCEAFAQKGFNVVLIGKNESKLHETALKLNNQNVSIQTRVIVADFSNCSDEGFFTNIYNKLKDLDISILVNNFVVDINPEKVETASETKLKHMIQTNTIPTVLMNRILINGLKLRTEKSKNRSAIITLSSHVAIEPLPLKIVYGATSLFNDFVSRGLALEYGSHKIDMLACRIPLKKKGPNNNDDKKFTVESVQICLNTLGRKSYTNGSWKAKGFWFMYSPTWIYYNQVNLPQDSSVFMEIVQ